MSCVKCQVPSVRHPVSEDMNLEYPEEWSKNKKRNENVSKTRRILTAEDWRDIIGQFRSNTSPYKARNRVGEQAERLPPKSRNNPV